MINMDYMCIYISTYLYTKTYDIKYSACRLINRFYITYGILYEEQNDQLKLQELDMESEFRDALTACGEAAKVSKE